MTDNDIHDRLVRLESIVDQQQETIEEQRETIEEQRERMEELTAEMAATSHPLLVADGGDVKVVGEIDADDGIGVHGKTTGDGITHAVEGVATSVNGRGVMGFVTSEDYEHNPFMAAATGVTGVTDRSGADDGIDEGVGVGGRATAESGLAYGVAGQCRSDDGFGVFGSNTGSGYGVFSFGDSLTWGDHEITDELLFADGTPQRTAGPVAKGYINADGTVENAVNVDDATWDSNFNSYVITLDDITYDNTEYVTVIMPMSTTYPDALPSDTTDGELQVNFDDKEQHDFAFVTYDLPDGTETTTVDTQESTDLPSGGAFGGQ